MKLFSCVNNNWGYYFSLARVKDTSFPWQSEKEGKDGRDLSKPYLNVFGINFFDTINNFPFFTNQLPWDLPIRLKTV